MKQKLQHGKQSALTLILALSFIFISQKAKSQVLLNEDFSGAILPAGWTVFNVDNLTPNSAVANINQAWIVDSDLLNLTEKVAKSTSWYTPAGTADDWIFTPAVNLPAAGTNFLSWDAIAYDNAFPDGYEVRIMTAAPNAGNLMSSTVLFSIASEASTVTPHSVTLTGYAGQTVYIGFRNNSTDQYVLAIDNIKVENILVTTPEVGITAVNPHDYSLIPQSQVSSFPISATVQNSGSGAATTVNLTTNVYKLPNLTTPVFTTTGSTSNLGNGATATITAAQSFTPSVPYIGDYVFESIISGNTGALTNDTMRYSVSVVPNWYARDNGTSSQAVGAGNTISCIIGNVFTVTTTSVLDSVLAFMYPTANGINDSIRYRITSVVSGVPSNTSNLGQSAMYYFTSADTGGTALVLPVTNMSGTPLVLTPGTYFIGAEKCMGSDNYGLQCAQNYFTPNTVFANINNGTYSPLSSLIAGFNYTPIIRGYLRCAPTYSMETQSACTSYTWPVNGNTYNTSGSYTATFTNALGCDSTIILNLTIASVINVGTVQNGDTITVNENGAVYQWIDCDNGNAIIPGATNQTFVATNNGNFAVIVTVGSCSDTSACVNVLLNNLSENAGLKEIRLAPNPNNGRFILYSPIGTYVEINNSIGETIRVLKTIGKSTSIDISDLRSGIYFITTNSPAGIKTLKVVKQ